MQRLTRPRGDDGAVAALVVVLLGIVLLAIGALVVDVGTLYAERRELQNGADFAALAVAADCATADGCPGGETVTAEEYADANAKDDAAAVDDVCGTAPGLSACSDKIGEWDCNPATGSAPYVQVRTSTETAGGTNLMPPLLSRTLLGNSGDAGKQVRACARAAYGAAGSSSGLAVTISYCEWWKMTDHGKVFAPPPPYPPNPALSYEKTIYLHETDPEGPCEAGPAGSDMPGGFGWVSDEDGTADCQATIDGDYPADTGVDVSKACKAALDAAMVPGTINYIPIYESATADGKTYTLKGFGAFVLTGYHLPGVKGGDSWLSGPSYADKCTGSSFCLYGFFTQGLVEGGEIGGTTLPGVWTTQLMG